MHYYTYVTNLNSELMVKHWLIRVGDGLNFLNSKYAMWGIKRGRGGCLKSIVKKFKPGDILWFFTSKKYGGKFIGMAEYTCMFDRHDEQLVRIHTLTNAEQNWTGSDDWSIQIHYKCTYFVFLKQKIPVCIQHPGIMFDYEKYIDAVEGNLYEHYRCFKGYGSCIEREELQ
jgi:hypothetical protein